MNDQNRKELSRLVAAYDKNCTSGMSMSDGHAAWEALVRFVDSLVEAARATPAQPAAECSYLRTPGTHCNKCGKVHGSSLHWTGAIAYTVWQWRKRGEKVWHDADQEVAVCGGDEYEYHCLYTQEGLPAKPPSPSSVGDAIRAMPLPYVKVPPNGAQTQWGRDMANCGAEVMREHIIALLPKLLSEAAALAEQVQGQQVEHPPCKGPNCGTTNSSHSLECQATHEAACAGGYFIKHDVLMEIIGCFQAAEIEGLRDVLAETPDERLKDLVQRRLMFAYEAALNAAPSIAQDGQKSEAK